MLLGQQLRAGGFQYLGNKVIKTSAVQQCHMHGFIYLLICVPFLIIFQSLL